MSSKRLAKRKNASYTYTHDFLFEQIEAILKPLRFTQELRALLILEYHFTPEEMRAIEPKVKKLVAKINAIFNSYYKKVFSRQAIDQVTEQIMNHERTVKLTSFQKIQNASQLLVPLVARISLKSDDLENILEKVQNLPAVKYLTVKQLDKVSKKDIEQEDAGYQSDESLIEIDSIEQSEVKQALRKYLTLKSTIDKKRASYVRGLQKLKYYQRLNESLKLQLVNSSQSVDLIQRNVISSQTEIFNEVAKLRVNLGKLMPKLNTGETSS